MLQCLGFHLVNSISEVNLQNLPILITGCAWCFSTWKDYEYLTSEASKGVQFCSVVHCQYLKQLSWFLRCSWIVMKDEGWPYGRSTEGHSKKLHSRMHCPLNTIFRSHGIQLRTFRQGNKTANAVAVMYWNSKSWKMGISTRHKGRHSVRLKKCCARRFIAVGVSLFRVQGLVAGWQIGTICWHF